MSEQQIKEALQNLKNQKPQKYHLIAQALTKLKETHNYQTCFRQINRCLVNEQKILTQINSILHQGTKFYSHIAFDQIEEMLLFMKQSHTEIYNQLSSELEEDTDQQVEYKAIVNIFRSFSKNCANFDSVITRMFSKPDSYINQRSLPHLVGRWSKSGREIEDKHEQDQQRERSRNKNKSVRYREEVEQNILRKLREKYPKISKLLLLYKEAIISFREFQIFVLDLMPGEKYIKDLLEMAQTRKNQRLICSKFRNLADLDPSDVAIRITQNYIPIPKHYPQTFPTQQQLHRQVLNNKCLAVTKEDTGNFQTRTKNSQEIKALKAEDQMHSIDVDILLTQRAIFLVEQFLVNVHKYPNAQKMGIMVYEQIQSLGLNGAMVQKYEYDKFDQFVNMAEVPNIDNLKEMLAKMKDYYTFLSEKKKEHQQKLKMTLTTSYNEIKIENFVKMEQYWMKNLEEKLNSRLEEIKELKRVGIGKQIQIFNSFEKVTDDIAVTHAYPDPFLEEQAQDNHKTPAFLFIFEDEEVTKSMYSMVEAYIRNNHYIMNQAQLKQILKSVLSCLDIQNFQTIQIADIDYQMKMPRSQEMKIAKVLQKSMPIDNWATIIQQQPLLSNQNRIIFQKQFNQKNTNEFASTTPIYCLIRLLFAFYERLLFAKNQYSSNNNSLFELLYYEIAYLLQNKKKIRSDDNRNEKKLYAKFLKQIFGENGYFLLTLFDLGKEIVEQLKIISECRISQICMKCARKEQNVELQLVSIKRQLQSENLRKSQLLTWKFDRKSKALLLYQPQSLSQPILSRNMNDYSIKNSALMEIQQSQQQEDRAKNQLISGIGLNKDHQVPNKPSQSQKPQVLEMPFIEEQ